ncbi:MAG: antitoxin [Acidobacteria bacterium SCN 69-37]|nr:MAG: antitoxin [Acidobacteria bacterium SCN 69-37]
MAKTTSFNLGDHFNSFLDRQVSQGRYGSASEVVRAGLRLLEEHEEARAARVAALRAAIVAGEDSGPAEPFDYAAFLKDQRAQHRG